MPVTYITYTTKQPITYSSTNDWSAASLALGCQSHSVSALYLWLLVKNVITYLISLSVIVAEPLLLILHFFICAPTLPCPMMINPSVMVAMPTSCLITPGLSNAAKVLRSRRSLSKHVNDRFFFKG